MPSRSFFAGACLALVAPVLLGPVRRRPRCPPDTAVLPSGACIDRYEATLVEIVGHGTRPWSPYEVPVRDAHYRAVTRRGVIPQAYVSQVQAEAACEAAHKRLCTDDEWVGACRGTHPTTWPYGAAQRPGACNDDGINPVPRLFPGVRDVFHEGPMNDARLNRLPHTLVRTGSKTRCHSSIRAFDMVGNLHEWVATRRGTHGVFRGGYFADVHENGDGCGYVTVAHNPGYHDYSTGFRCCADAR